MKRSRTIRPLAAGHCPSPPKLLAPLLCGLAVLFAVPAASTADQNATGRQEQPVSDEEWTIQIIPQASPATRVIQRPGPRAAIQPELKPLSQQEPVEKPQPDEPEAKPPENDRPEAEPMQAQIVPMLGCIDLASRYREVYNSIPFIRSEYEANPSYRHEATMEILFGRLRPMVVHKHAPPPAVVVPPPVPALPFGWYSIPPHGYPYVLPGHFPGFDYDLSRGPYSRYQHLFGYAGGYPLKHYLW